MIRQLTKAERGSVRHHARRQWRTIPVPFAIIDVQGFGRSVVCMRRIETRWSDRQRRRLWRLPVPQLARRAMAPNHLIDGADA